MTGADPSTASPIFLLGNPRSGTTMVRLMLTSHRAIGIPPESEFIVKLYSAFGHISSFSSQQAQAFRAALSGEPINLAEQWEVSLDELIPSDRELIGMDYATVCASIYQSYQAAKGLPRTEMWGDKNNAYGQYVDLLASLFPKAKFIHLVRDGRAVLNSYRKLEVSADKKYAPLLPQNASMVALRWRDAVERIERHLKRYAPDRSISLRYEDVLADPEGQSRRLCDFLGLEYDPDMLEFHTKNAEQGLEPRSYSWKANTFQPLDAQKGAKWLSELCQEDLKAFEAVARPLLVDQGYEPTMPNAAGRSGSLKFAFLATTREYLRHLRVLLVNARKRLTG